jgi:hypothetical protein
MLYPGRQKGFWVGLGLIALLLALGGYSALHGWLYATIPGFGQLRAPARFILLLDLALAALAALGLDTLLRQSRPENVGRLLPKLLTSLTWLLGGLIVVAGPLSYYAMLVKQAQNPAIFNRAVSAAAGGAGWLYYPHCDCSAGATGDGYTLAYDAGAVLTDMEQVQFVPFAMTHPSSMVGVFIGDPDRKSVV